MDTSSLAGASSSSLLRLVRNGCSATCSIPGVTVAVDTFSLPVEMVVPLRFCGPISAREKFNRVKLASYELHVPLVNYKLQAINPSILNLSSFKKKDTVKNRRHGASLVF